LSFSFSSFSISSARAYSEAGMRAAIAPMMTARTPYEAIPGLAEAFVT
jgi:hypothetical protein